MIPYVRLAYASTATAKPARIRNDLLQIFESTRQYNFNHQLTGVMLYGNGYFFQCLEGRKTQVDGLYQHLLKDPRHQNVALLSYEHRSAAQFGQWNQRYVRFEPPVEHFFNQNELMPFNPYLLNTQLIHPFMDLLYEHAASNAHGPSQALMALEASQNGYAMSFKDMLMVSVLIVLALIPVYLVVMLVPGTTGFSPF